MNIEGYTYITHKLINRPWYPECRYTFAKPDSTHINEVIRIPSMEITNEDLIDLVSAALAKRKAAEDREAKFCRIIDSWGPELKEALLWLVRKVREYPNATLAQAETAWNAEWSDSLFEFDRMVTWMRNQFGGVTWDGFKTYVINHYFEGVD